MKADNPNLCEICDRVIYQNATDIEAKAWKKRALALEGRNTYDPAPYVVVPSEPTEAMINAGINETSTVGKFKAMIAAAEGK